MTEPSSQSLGSSFILWHAEGGGLSVEFSRLVLEQIRQACFASTDGVHRGGNGIGGILLGTRFGSLWRVLGWSQIACDYSRGEAFHLDAEDESRLRKQLGEPFTTGMGPLGWFCSHPRGGLSPSQEDRRIHELYFNHSERLMLTVRLLRSGDLAIAVHSPSPERDGLLRARQPEIRIVPMSRSEFETAESEAESHAVAPPAPSILPEALPGAQSTYFAFGFAIVLVVAAALGILAWQLAQSAPAAALSVVKASPSAEKPARLLSLYAEHRSARLRVQWDPQAYDPGGISSASITWAAGSVKREVRVGPAALKNGRTSIALKMQPDIVTLSLRTTDGPTIQDSVSFIASRKKN